MTPRTRWILDHWKLGVHLIFRTKRFGVNNDWWFDGESMFGYPLWRILLRTILIYPLILEYRLVKCRAIYMCFLSDETCRMLWGENCRDWLRVPEIHSDDK